MSEKQDVKEVEPTVDETADEVEAAPMTDGAAAAEEVEAADDEEPKTEEELLREALAEAEAKAAENLDGWQRARAEFQNYKRRMEAQLSESRQQAASNVLSRFFPVLDDFELALENLPADGDGAQWAAGIQLVHRKLLGLLEAEGVTPIVTEPGESFDPNYHEALTQEEHDEYEEGAIIDVVRRGYQLGDRVLRPAQVRVAR